MGGTEGVEFAGVISVTLPGPNSKKSLQFGVMILTHLRLIHWRNIASAALELRPGLTVFTGQNAQGKTNILEGVHYLATASSHRTRRDQELIQWGESTAYICGEITGPTTSHLVECGIEPGKRLLKHDGQPLARWGPLRDGACSPVCAGGPGDHTRQP